MISKPQGYDEAAALTGESMQLPAGRYVCMIKQVGETKTQNGRTQMAVLFDVDEGEYKNFYQSKYDAAKRMNRDKAKWKGVHKQTMDGTSLPFFKGMITSIEKSNLGFVFPWGQEGNEKTLIGKKFGAVMGREQFEASDGNRLFTTKIIQIRSIDGLKYAKIPEDKLLPENTAPSTMPAPDSDGFMSIPDGITDEELPFM